MRHTLRFSVAVALVILFIALAVLSKGPQSIDEVNAQGTCTLKTIKGTYLFQGEGVVIDEAGEVVPYAEAGTWTLDGEGSAEGVISGSMNGVAFATRDAFTATYTLDSGCAYAVVDAFGLQLDLYTTPSGRTMTYFAPGFSGTHVRQ
jgi:hypothetical protein